MSKLRSYEVSIWTLQDSFITVLKSSNLEHKGQILDPNMTLKDDGDNKFSFKIPMYIRDEDGKLKENPIWYNTYNGNIIANLRKIKIIFNKKQKLEEVFEFIIINVTESHEGNRKYCFVECEGLAFHELGKQGYKISFDGQDELIEAQKKWRESPENSGFIECPQGNINYWANKIFKNSNWIYSIRMDWSAYDGIVHQTYTLPNNTVLDSDNYDNFTEDERYNFNTMRENDNLRRRDKIYEDAYVSSWNSIKENEEVVDLIPTSVIEIQEKYRPIKANESNRYNLSQTLAEQFQVFCKYKYYYDDNYHIIKREAIFYNNFINENNEIIDFTYKYNTENISRKMDSTEAVTKMFVRTIKDQDTPSGECSIIDTTANKSGEDYILNFDYMYNIGTITKEQYDEIKIYEAKLHEINKEYSECKEELIIKTNKRNKLESDIQTSKDAINTAIEQISIASAALENVEQINENGAIEIEASNPQILPLKIKQGDQYYYCDFNTDGIYADSIKLYRTINRTNRTLDDEITSFGIRFNEIGDPIGVDTLTKPNPNINNIYATYKYDALLHYQRIDDTYTSFLNKHQNVLSEKENDLENINSLIQEKENQCEEYLRQKEKIISDFEKMMGPALREGKWQPEDIYSGHGDIHDNEEYETTLNSTFNNSELTSFGWDNELFDDEQNFFYEYGLYQTKYYYPCIKLTQNIVNNFGTNEEFLSKINFRFTNTLNKNQYMAIGSQMVTGFIKNNNTITPVLILLGAKDVPTTQQNKMKTAAALCFISVESGEINEDKTYSISANDWLIAPDQISNNFSSYQIVYPRFQINSQFLRSPETNIEIRQGTSKTKLENYKDFYILTRNAKWYITLKPNTFLKLNINQNSKYYLSYIISTAALAVYLDAIQILKENAYPKVSYEINISSLYEDFIKNAYQRLGQIAHINDYEFKFQNVMGYISELNLNLEKPWEDKIIIKNYKTKFEDLFSTIVAETEQMKKNSAVIGAAINYLGLDGSSGKLYNDIYQIINNYNTVNSPIEKYLEYESIIKSQLKEAFDEAGKVLSAAQKSVNDVDSLNISNRNILRLFKEDIKKNLTPTTFTTVNGKRYNTILNQEVENFKVGDIWTYNGNTYMATENSEQLYPNGYPSDILTSLKGWSLVKDGSLAQIKGASFNLDSEHGTIEFEAVTSISARSGNNIALQANNDILIQANNTVDINGAQINLNSLSNTNPPRGILIQAVNNYNDKTASSKINIKSSGIEMMTAGGISMAGAGGINIYTSNNTFSGTSAISISKDKGVYIGSGKSIILYSGEVPADITSSNYASKGASVLINKDRILFGVSDGNSGSAVDLTKDYIVFGSSFVNSNYLNNVPSSDGPEIGSKNGSAGVKISKDYIGLATGTATKNGNNYTYNNRNYIEMSSSGIKIANAYNENNGAIVTINKNGVLIGTASNATTYITDIQSTNSNAHNLINNYNGAKFQVYAPNFVVDASGHLYAYAADIAGKIRASSGQIGGWTIGTDGLYLNNITPGANTSTLVFSKGTKSTNSIGGSPANTEKTWMISASNKFGVTTAGDLYANSANITGNIVANSLTIKNNNTYVNIGDYVTNLITDNAGDFVTSAQLRQTADSITTTVSQTYLSKTEAGNTYETISNVTTISQQASAIELSVKKITEGATPVPYVKSSKITIQDDAITIVSGGKIDITSTNFIINSNATGSNPIFQVGNTSNSYIQYTANGTMTVTGTINAKAGNIGGCSIDANGNLKITSANISGTLSIGQVDGAINSATAVSIANGQISVATISCNQLSGGTITGQVINNGNGTFYVDASGNLTATSATIQGAITATSGSIPGWNIDANGVYHGQDGILTGMFSQSWDAGSPPLERRAFIAGNGAFSVTYGGYLYAYNAYIKGTIEAGSGTIAGLNIYQTYLGKGDTRGSSPVGISFTSNIPNDNSLDPQYAAFWAGGVDRADGTGRLDPANTAFFVRGNGYVHITKGEIHANYLMSSTPSNTRYYIRVTSAAPSTNSFSVADGRFNVGGVLWINPDGTPTTDNGVTRQSCTVYWCTKA